MWCSCGNSIEGTTGKCAQCNREERKLQKLAQKEKPKPKYIKQVSKKRSKEMGEYKKIQQAYIAAHPVCECCNVAPSNEIHHKAGRVAGELINYNKFLAVCRPCHMEIEANPKWAKENGFSENRI